jgi:hypothetical protein
MIFNVAGITPGPTAGELVNAVKRRIPKAELRFRPDAKISRIVDSWSTDHSLERINAAGWRPSYSNLDVLVDDFIDEVQAKRRR